MSLSISGPHLTRFVRSIRAHNAKRHLDQFSRFCTDDCRVSLDITMGCPFPLKITPSHGGSARPSNTRFPGPTWVLNPDSVSIGAAVFAGLASVRDRRTDWQTDHATRSVKIGRIYICSTAMWPNNNRLCIRLCWYWSWSKFIIRNISSQNFNKFSRCFI